MQTARESMPSSSGLDELVKCNRCKNVHLFGDRVCLKDKKYTYKTHIVCPKCECKVTIKPSLKAAFS